MKKRVLIITYYWPPSGGSGVQRWLKTSKYLPEFGWEPVIYTPLNPDVNSVDESLLKDVSSELEVIKRKIREPYAAYKFLSGKKKGEHLQANLIATKKSFF
ncbi:MAG: glycosyl transferase family 1, partial [Bacteroidales bacterium]|nr:glycosyl transferase family 1 [Bacteroidales bacterium]